jgi:hypothetical protein
VCWLSEPALSGARQVCRPSLPAMENRQDFEPIAALPVGNQVRGVRHNQFTGAFRSRGRPHDLSQRVTSRCATLRPASSSLLPAWISSICQSSASTNAAMASAARNDFERRARLASVSSCFFVLGVIRTERVVVIYVCLCCNVHNVTRSRPAPKCGRAEAMGCAGPGRSRILSCRRPSWNLVAPSDLSSSSLWRLPW